MKYCPKCHKEYVDTLNFCTDDGTLLVAKSQSDTNKDKNTKESRETNRHKTSWIKRVFIVFAVIAVTFCCLIHYVMNAATYLRVEPNQLAVSKSGGSITVDIDYDGYVWTINHKPDWVEVYENDDDFEVHVDKNTTGNNREGSITIQSGKQLAQVIIAQKCVATYLNTSTNQLHFKKKGGTEIVSIGSDGGDWFATYPDYLQVKKVDEETLSVKALTNSDEFKSGYITIKEDNLSRTIQVSQGGKCNFCHGNGEIMCSACFGQGGTGFGMYYMRCIFCGGNGKNSCNSCDGTGYKE